MERVNIKILLIQSYHTTCVSFSCEFSYKSERPGKIVYTESISFFIAYICLHNIYFHSVYNCNQGVNMLQKLPHNLTVARLMHKYTYSLVKMLLKNWYFSKETLLFETIKQLENYELDMY